MAKTKSQPSIVGIPWSLKTIWNERLDAQPERPLLPRNYLYASELGSAFSDRYLKMNAVPYTNPPNFRSKRKFAAGDAWEWLVGLVLMSSNMLQKKQIKVDTQLNGYLSVHGRLDFIAGGKFDYDSAMKQVELVNNTLTLINIETPPFFMDAAAGFIKKYKDQFLEEVIYECKTVSTFMMEKVQKTGAMSHHILQDYHYVKGNEQKILKGKIGYVCKDDCLMEEFDVLDNPAIKKLYVTDIKQMSEFYNRGFDKNNPQRLMPPKEKAILFEEGLWRFTKNFKVEYSPYLKMLHGFETPEDFRNSCQGKIASWSRAFKRFVLEGKEVKTKVKGEIKISVMELTASNKEKRAECIKEGFDWDKLVKAARKDGAFVDADETEEE